MDYKNVEKIEDGKIEAGRPKTEAGSGLFHL